MRHFLVAAETWQPWFVIEPAGNPRYSGIMWDVLVQLSKSLNFTFSIVRPPDGKWGVLEPNGMWNGMIGMVRRNEVDFALGPFGMSAERAEVVDYTHPLRQDILVTVSPVGLVPDLWAVWRPFGWRVWAVFLVSCLGFLLIFGWSDRWMMKRADWSKKSEFLLRTIAGDGSVPIPKHWNYQLVFSMLWILAMFILGQGYAGTLASLMTIPKVPKMIDDVEDLVAQKDIIPWGLESGSILEQTGAQAQPGSLLYDFYQGSVVSSGSCYGDLDNIKGGRIIRLCEGLTALSMLSDDFSREAQCNMYAGKGSFMSFSYGIAIQKANNITGAFNGVIHAMTENGMIEDAIASSLPNATMCDSVMKIVRSHGKRADPLSLRALVALGGTFLVGLILGLGAFIGEMIFHKVPSGRALFLP